MNFFLYRYNYTNVHTQGLLFHQDQGYLADTLERPWLDNHPDTSCIPEGLYQIEPYFSPKRREFCIRLFNVPGRTDIEIHEATTVFQLTGCIGIGTKAQDVLFQSRTHLNSMLSILGDSKGVLMVKRFPELASQIGRDLDRKCGEA